MFMWGVCFTREGEGELYRGLMHVCVCVVVEKQVERGRFQWVAIRGEKEIGFRDGLQYKNGDINLTSMMNVDSKIELKWENKKTEESNEADNLLAKKAWTFGRLYPTQR